jgi:hypothetical protein
MTPTDLAAIHAGAAAQGTTASDLARRLLLEAARETNR